MGTTEIAVHSRVVSRQIAAFVSRATMFVVTVVMDCDMILSVIAVACCDSALTLAMAHVTQPMMPQAPNRHVKHDHERGEFCKKRLHDYQYNRI